MTKIFVTGGSGLGKSVFCERLATEFDLPYVSEGARTLFKDSDLESMSFDDRQYALIAHYAALHHRTDDLISDRSLIDILVWSYLYNDNSVSLPHLPYTNEYHIVVPTLCSGYYERYIDKYTGDEYRKSAYLEMMCKLGIPLSPMTLHLLSSKLQLDIEEMCQNLENRGRGCKYYVAKRGYYDNDNPWKHWQEDALRWLRSQLIP